MNSKITEYGPGKGRGNVLHHMIEGKVISLKHLPMEFNENIKPPKLLRRKRRGCYRTDKRKGVYHVIRLQHR